MRPWFLALLLLPRSVVAQWPAPYLSSRLQPGPLAPAAAFQSTSDAPSFARVWLGGLAGSAVGLGAGLLAYAALDSQRPCLASDCDSELGTGLVAATVGMTLGAPIGAHLADRRRGSLLKGFLVSAATAGAVWGGAAIADDARWLLLLPPLQITLATLAERRPR